MCIIIDNNVVHRVLGRSDDPDFALLTAAIFGRRSPNVKVVYGGRLALEYRRSPQIFRVITELERAGRAQKVRDSRVNAEETTVVQSGLCVSDDPHVIALARVSGVRLLCSHDRALHADFTNQHLLKDPRGNVYQNDASHEHLLRQHC